jgi:16S rRNA (guanine527-N7)-methyltransferase
LPDPALSADLSEGLGELSLELPPGAIETLLTLVDLVEGWGRRMNLTGHGDSRTIVRRLVLDAAALLVHLPSFETAADLGAGAGFPGLPLAILRPDASVFLVEARERRHHFQRQVIRKLGLENAEAIRGRFEDVEPVRCDLVVAQAVGTPEKLVGSMLRWAGPGAVLAVPGGKVSRSTGGHEGLANSEVVSYAVPLGGPQRSLWLGRAL